MSSLTFASPGGGLFPNGTTVTAHTSCMPCSAFNLIPGIGDWGLANPSIPAIRTVQLVIDPNYNTTSTSIQCNSAALSAYKTHTQEPEMYSLDDDCNLVARYLVDGMGSSMQLGTVTMTASTGRHIELGSRLWIQGINGEISTTDSNGDPTCLNSWTTTLATPMGLYTGRIETKFDTWTLSTTSTTVIDDKTTTITSPWLSVHPAELWLMPDLKNLFPGIAAIEQCTTVIPGGSPVALTRANEIVLPILTLPLTKNTASSTPMTRPSSRPAAPLPGSSNVIALPISTTTSSHTTKAIVKPTLTDAESESSSKGTQRPASQGGDEREPPANNGPPSGSPSGQPLASTRNIDILPVNPVPDSPTRVSHEEPKGGRRSESAVQQQGQSSLPQSGEVMRTVEIVPVRPVKTPNGLDDINTITRVTSIPGVGSVSTIDNMPDDYALGTGTVLSAGGPAATIGGTMYTALPSGSGVIAVTGEPGDAFAPYIALGVSGDNSKSDGDNVEAAYVLGEGTTLAASQDGIIVSGTTYSALPSGVGVLEIANGRTATITTFAPLSSEDAGPVHAYVLGGSATVSAGGTALTFSGTTYTALPSGGGVLEVANGRSNTVTAFAPAVSDNIGPVGTYILGGSATISAGGTAVTISGTTYSALPSGAGVLVAADGASSTKAVTASDDTAWSTAIVGAEDDSIIAPYTGSASAWTQHERVIAVLLGAVVSVVSMIL